MYCPYCGTKLVKEEIDSSTKCAKCGKNLGELQKESKFQCHSCGRDCPDDAAYCWFCGEKFTGETTEEKNKTPKLASLFYGLGALEIIGGIILCFTEWSKSNDQALTWLFYGYISGLLFFAIGEILKYLKKIQFLLEE